VNGPEFRTKRELKHFRDAESSTSTTNLDLTELHLTGTPLFIRQVSKCT